MFQPNDDHEQSSLFGLTNQMSETQMERLKETKYAVFYEVIFKQIPEEQFKEMYSQAPSRPNTPVNQLVGAEILKMMNGWTDEELFDHLYFDMRMKYALGIDESEEVFCPATLYNFRNRVETYERETGINPFEEIFVQLTDEHKQQFGIETGIQRMDSFQAMSNVREYTRLQLVVEVLQRLYRALSEEDQQKHDEIVESYVGEDSGTWLYQLDPARYEEKLKELGEVYQRLYHELKGDYADTDEFQVFERVFHEQYEVAPETDGPVTLRGGEELGSDCLQSPDDEDATYRSKQGEEYRGQSAHVTETCDPANDVQLINDVFVTANNVDDSSALNERLQQRPDRYETIDELFVDGAYGSEENDEWLEDRTIDMVQTGIRGRPPDVRLDIRPIEDGTYEVSCPNQTVQSKPTRTRHKAVFDSTVCEECPLAKECPTQPQKQGRVHYFDEADAKRSQRLNRLDEMPEEKQTLRNNVEATVKEFTRGMNHKGKLRVRGRFRTKLWALCLAMGLNLERIHRYLVDKAGDTGLMEPLKDLMGDLCGYLWFGTDMSWINRENQIRPKFLQFVT